MTFGGPEVPGGGAVSRDDTWDLDYRGERKTGGIESARNT